MDAFVTGRLLSILGSLDFVELVNDFDLNARV